MLFSKISCRLPEECHFGRHRVANAVPEIHSRAEYIGLIKRSSDLNGEH